MKFSIALTTSVAVLLAGTPLAGSAPLPLPSPSSDSVLLTRLAASYVQGRDLHSLPALVARDTGASQGCVGSLLDLIMGLITGAGQDGGSNSTDTSGLGSNNTIATTSSSSDPLGTCLGEVLQWAVSNLLPTLLSGLDAGSGSNSTGLISNSTTNGTDSSVGSLLSRELLERLSAVELD